MTLPVHRLEAIRGAHEARAAAGVPLDLPLDDVLLRTERLGLPVVLAPLHGIAGAYVRRPALALAFVSTDDAPVRRRFTLAHELGHHVLHGAAQVDTEVSLGDWDGDPIEAGANWFAAEFLAPEEAVRRCVEELDDRDATLELVVRVAHRFAISAHAACIRLHTAGVLRRGRRLQRLLGECQDGTNLKLQLHLGLAECDDVCRLGDGALVRLPAQARGTALESWAQGRLDASELARALGHDPGRVAGTLG